MEGSEPSVSTSSPNVTCSSSGNADADAFELKFAELCKKKLLLDEATYSTSMKLFKDTKHLLLSNMSVLGGGTGEEAVRYWCAFVLYSISRLTEWNEERRNSGIGFTLCQILKAAELNMVDFFNELPHFIVKAGAILSVAYGKSWENRLEAKELQANFVHLSHLSKYFKRAYSELFLVYEAHGNESDGGSTSNKVSEYQRFGWMLFLALRVHAFSNIKNIVTCMNGLVSILVIMIVHLPTRFRNFSLSDASRFVRRSDRGVDLVASLCKIYETSEDEVKKTLKRANSLIATILKKTLSPASLCKLEILQDIDSDSLIYFEGLMDESSLSSSLSALEKDYENSVQCKGELDERVFLNEEDSLLGSGTLSGGAINMTGTKRKFDAFSSPSKTITIPLSPYRTPSTHVNGTVGGNNGIRLAAATPVSTAMTTAKWLRTVVSPLPSELSAELKKFLAYCDKDITDDVIRRINVILEAIFPNTVLGECSATGGLQITNLMDNLWAEQRRLEAMKLYYRVLEAMCRAESQILHSNNLTSLLTNERFHRCMLACSAELVLATHKTVTMLFPAVLERTGITAFDLSKVIESFIRHEESLPRELRRHLNTLEERLLEKMVWEKGSSMYNSLIVAKPALAAEINRLSLFAEPMPSLDAIAMHINYSSGRLSRSPLQRHETSSGPNGDIRSPKRPCVEYRSVLVERNSFTSPVRDCLLAFSCMKSKLPPPPLQSAFASPTRPHPGGGDETCAETGINILFTKITKLAAVRINGLLERLQLSQQIKESVYSIFQQILNLRTSLFFNRHIDQIILCSFYGVAKISQTSLTFKEIINNYKQPHCKPQVFRNVFVDWSSAPWSGKSGHDLVDIIMFYNEMFIPSVKPLLVELGPGKSSRSDVVTEVGGTNDAQCPASPKTSIFPNLPDMSPKKISPSHKVYVSPLRSSKMDASISHSSRSYYACVGESTRAYQSPSKDLAAINDRLNGNRKVRCILKFDVDAGLVSDSLVANSLCLQNGSCASSTSASVPEQHISREL